MSVSARRLRRVHQGEEVGATSNSVVAGAGYNFGFSLGTGYRHLKKESKEMTPIKMLSSQPILASMANYHGAVLRADRTLDVFGQNIANQSPWTTGPEGLWAGVWQYRKNLENQRELIEKGSTWPEITEKEKKFELESVGQVVYVEKAVVIWNGYTWIAQKRNTAVEPGTDELYWKLHPTQVQQFQRGESKTWFVYSYNLVVPARAPQIRNIKSLASNGSHGVAVLLDGSIRTWGRAMKYGISGTKYNASYGPKPRPLGSPPARKQHFTGTVKAGWPWIEKLEGVKEQHNKAGGGTCGYGLVTGPSDTTLFTPSSILPENAHVWGLQEYLPVYVTTTAALPSCTATGGTLEATATGTLTIDGKEPAVGKRVLVKNQAESKNNGVYEITVKGAVGVKWKMKRTTDLNIESHLESAAVITESGTANENRAFNQLNTIKKVNESKQEWVEIIGVESIVSGSVWKTIAFVATTEALPACTASGENLEANAVGKLEIDGEELTVGKRVLVKNQAESKNDGIYEITVKGEAGAKWKMKRTADANTAEGLNSAAISIEKGDANKEFVFKQTKTVTVVGTSEQVWNRVQIKVETEEIEPTVRKVLCIKMKENAISNYTGVIEVQRAAKEVKFWPPEGYPYDAGWPVTPPLPEKVRKETGKLEPVKCVAVDTGAHGGSASSLALTDEGEVLAWGTNIVGQLGDLGETNNEHFANVPQFVKVKSGANMTGVVGIVCGGQICVAIKEDHTVWAWGGFNGGAAGRNEVVEEGKSHSSIPVQIPFPTAKSEWPIAIAANAAATTHALLANGKMMAVGSNEHGEIGNGIIAGKNNGQWKGTKLYSVGAKVFDIGPYKVGEKELYDGVNYKCKVAVTSEGGSRPGNDPTHWEVESVTEILTPVEVISLSEVNYIHGRGTHTAAVTASGSVYCWGQNAYGQLANGTLVNNGTPQKVNFGEGIKCWSVCCGEFNTLFVLEGEKAPEDQIRFTLHPEGEVGGEQTAYLDINWKSSLGTTGWKLIYHRQPTWWEEQELEGRIIEIEEILEEPEEYTAEEVAEFEEELEELLQQQEEEEAAGTTIPITPESLGGEKLFFRWISPGRLTKSAGYQVKIYNENVSFKRVEVFTNGLWESPYGGI